MRNRRSELQLCVVCQLGEAQYPSDAPELCAACLAGADGTDSRELPGWVETRRTGSG